MEIQITYKHISMSNDDEQNRLIINSPEKFYDLKYRSNTRYAYTYKDGLFALATVHRYGDVEELEQTFRDYKERNKSTYRSDLNI